MASAVERLPRGHAGRLSLEGLGIGDAWATGRYGGLGGGTGRDRDARGLREPLEGGEPGDAHRGARAAGGVRRSEVGGAWESRLLVGRSGDVAPDLSGIRHSAATERDGG